MGKELMKPDYLFEVSWEVCNKVGGIYTVLATKALHQMQELKRHHIFIGPDVWMHSKSTNPDFIEDRMLYHEWKAQAAEEGLRVSVGRWNIPGNPIAILVDFKKFLPEQNDILARYWEKFGVDSITGDWDYKESALFGYVAGKVIESFYRFNLNPSDKVVAQFHEWMTGAGVLYIRDAELPIATVFTTHATTLGRCLAGNNLPLYDSIRTYNGDAKAREFNVLAKHSLEKASAKNADVFTTVSEITAVECGQFLEREVDIVTPNGFENSFTPSSDEEFASKRSAARDRFMEVASAMSGAEVDGDSVFVGIGGRYEWRNKGIDVFVDALDRLKRSGYSGKTVHAFIMIPSGIKGPDKELVALLSGAGSEHTTQTSHDLINPEYDVVMRRFDEVGLKNLPDDKVKVYFIPSYLNGNDGVFNMPYYDLLPGLDLALFPSYYEPWGYTPLESVAFKVPTLTTSIAGFGKWVTSHYNKEHPGITIVERNDSNYSDVVDGVVGRIREIAALSDEERSAYRDNAKDVSEIALWENNIVFYKQAYSKALEKIVEERGAFPEIRENKIMQYKRKVEMTQPSWTNVFVARHLPDKLKGLEILSRNLWWCWNEDARELFKSVDPEAWEKSGGNPISMLDMVGLDRYNALVKDAKFVAKLDSVLKEFSDYMALKAERTSPSIAYFCMEYGLDTSLKIYSGGLGILAGDYLKETSDMNVNLTAIGLLYRYGYFTQKLSAHGEQVSTYEAQDFMKIPAQPVRDAEGEWVIISIAFPGRTLKARLWRVDVGRTELYLMDTDFEGNIPEDRSITHHLYGGDLENRLKQELLLGVGGIRALRSLGLYPEVYHCNEGHAAFIGMERLREYILHENLDYPEAMEVVRASSVYTTHTPVPAGHDAFDEGLLRKYIGHYPERLKIDWTTMMDLGKFNPDDINEKFSMSNLAISISQEVNGVSWLHGEVSKKMFNYLWPGYLPDELFISYVTNGVHYPTWCAEEWKQIHSKVFGDKFRTHHYDKECFKGIYDVEDSVIWATRTALRKRLIAEIKDRLSDPTASNHYTPQEVITIKEKLRDNVLTIGFARRFATYKRAYLLFRDLDRLNAIVNNPKRPVQFIFAGKAHPADKAGQDLIKRIVDVSKMEQFIGKIVFVPNYDITLAKFLVQGVDVWMNNPTRPQEASGTSGEKAAMNGVMHFSVLDGWWVEGYKPGAGWALPMEITYEDNNYQDELDAATIYAIIENEIAPTYYHVDKDGGYSTGWISHIKNTIAQVACNFTTNRMLTDYINQYYVPQAKRVAEFVADDFKLAREMVAWRKHVHREWNNVGVVSITKPDSVHRDLSIGKEFIAEVVLSVGDLSPEDVGVEMLLANTDSHGETHIQETYRFECVENSGGVVKYRASILPKNIGHYQIAARIFATNPHLAHRQDCDLVRWL